MGAAVIAVVLPARALGAAPARYSLVHGCYSLTGVAGAQRVRMQATALGRYLLYRPDRTFVAAQPDGSVGIARQPSTAADWPLAGSSDPSVNAALALLCHLQVSAPS